MLEKIKGRLLLGVVCTTLLVGCDNHQEPPTQAPEPEGHAEVPVHPSLDETKSEVGMTLDERLKELDKKGGEMADEMSDTAVEIDKKLDQLAEELEEDLEIDEQDMQSNPDVKSDVEPKEQ
jgi:hypothetical protein